MNKNKSDLSVLPKIKVSQISTVRIDDLDISDRWVTLNNEKLIASIKETGLQVPVLVDAVRFTVIDGGRRLAALRELGAETVEVVLSNDFDTSIKMINMAYETEPHLIEPMNAPRAWDLVRSMYPQMRRRKSVRSVLRGDGRRILRDATNQAISEFFFDATSYIYMRATGMIETDTAEFDLCVSLVERMENRLNPLGPGHAYGVIIQTRDKLQRYERSTGVNSDHFLQTLVSQLKGIRIAIDSFHEVTNVDATKVAEYRRELEQARKRISNLINKIRAYEGNFRS